MNYSEYIKKYNGKSIDFDNMYGIQCVDLADHYVVNCLGLQVGYYGNARNWVDNFKKSSWLQKYFTLIKCTFKSNEVMRGDIGVRCSGTNGHIFIVDSQNGSKFTFYDENNGGTHAPMTKRTKTYSSDYITHLLRPKDRSNIEMATNKPNVKIGDTVVFSANRTCYKGYGSDTVAYKINELSGFMSTEKATRRKGISAKVTAIKTMSTGNVWIEYLMGTHKVYSCIYEKAGDKKLIK